MGVYSRIRWKGRRTNGAGVSSQRLLWLQYGAIDFGEGGIVRG